jgi:hypothetical protein
MADDISENTERKGWICKKWLGVFTLFMLSGCLVMMLGCLVSAVLIVRELKSWEPFTTRRYYPSRPDGNEVSFIEGNADITLPPSAYDIYVYSTGFREIDTKVRFSMSTNELDEFVKSTLCQEPLRQIESGQQSTSAKTFEWWTPDQAKHLKSCSGTKDHSHQTVEIDMTDSRIYVVFVSTSIY